MVGFVNDSSIKVKEEENIVDVQFSEVNKVADLCLPEIDHLSLAYADSFLDFDCLKDWEKGNTEPYMADLKQESVLIGTEKSDFGVSVYSFVVGQEVSCKGEIVEDGLDIFSSLIEEELGKVSLEGVVDDDVFNANGSNVMGEGVDCIAKAVTSGGCEMKAGVDDCKKIEEIVCAEGMEIRSVEMEKMECGGEKSFEIVGAEGDRTIGSSEVSGIGGNALTIDGSVTKSSEKVSDGESDSESEESESSGSSTSDSSSSSSDDEEDDDDDEEDEEEDEEEDAKNVVKKKGEEVDVEEGEIMDVFEEEMVAWSDEDGEFGKAGPIMSANEIKILPPVPPVAVTLEPCHETLPVGAVLSIVGAQVIVEGMEKHNPLNEGSILWITEKRSPLGIVDEIFGPVKNPYYIVRYNSENEVPDGIQQGTLISFVPEFVNHVLNNGNLYKKGYDASGENDEELSEELEFSDDEKEAEYKRLQKLSKRGPNGPTFESRKKNKSKGKRGGGQWGGQQQVSGSQPNEIVGQVLSNQSQQFPPPSSLDRGNSSNSLQPVQAFPGGSGLVPMFPQVAQIPGFVAPSSGVWMNGIPCQPPQSVGFRNGPTPNNMLQLQQNFAHQPFQMPPFNGMPLQQQFNTGQMMPSHFVFPGGQSNFNPGATFTPMNPMMIGQNNFSQLQAAMSQNNCGPSQPAMSQINPNPLHPAFGQPISSPSQAASNMQGQHALEMQRQNVPASQTMSATPGSTGVSQNFNAAGNGRGRNSYRRGGGRFRGGRGRQQQSR